MRNTPEFKGQPDPRQHLINLGVAPGIIELNEFILRRAESLDDIGRVIKRTTRINTSLGGTQITSPLVRALYADDPLVRNEFKKQLGVKFVLPDEVVDTYYQAAQYGWVDVHLRHKEVAEKLRAEPEFITTADSIAFVFLRSYLGFSGSYIPDKAELEEEYAKITGNMSKILQYPEEALRTLSRGSDFLNPTEFSKDLDYFRKHKGNIADAEAILEQLVKLDKSIKEE